VLIRIAQGLVALCAAAIILPIILVLLPAVVSWWLVWGNMLRLWFWSAHRRHGRSILFVYSDSPNWQNYIEENLLPRLEGHAVVLNWSRRKQWNRECWWEARVFHHWAGGRAFNPLALVFVGRWRVLPFRFFQPFRDFKHGKEESLRRVEAELLRYLPAKEAAV
jgi:hypothetical protein